MNPLIKDPWMVIKGMMRVNFNYFLIVLSSIYDIIRLCSSSQGVPRLIKLSKKNLFDFVISRGSNIVRNDFGK